MRLENRLPFEIVFGDPDDLTGWDTIGDLPDPVAAGWAIEPMGGKAFLVTAPSGEECEIDGRLWNIEYVFTNGG